jgi:hypothetical protein
VKKQLLEASEEGQREREETLQQNPANNKQISTENPDKQMKKRPQIQSTTCSHH